MDCMHPAHDDVHFVAEDDDGIFGQVKEHTTELHPEITDEQIREMISQSAYSE